MALKSLRIFLLILLASAFSLAQTIAVSSGKTAIFIGEISDTQCAFRVHSRQGTHTDMLLTNIMGKTAADCARSCVRKFGGGYVLVDEKSKKVHRLAGDQNLDEFAAQRVAVTGTLDNDGKILHMIKVELLP